MSEELERPERSNYHDSVGGSMEYYRDLSKYLESSLSEAEGMIIQLVDQVKTLQDGHTFYNLYIQRRDKVTEFKDALETAVTGLEWWNSSYPDGSSPTDDEHITKFKALIDAEL